MNPSTKGTTMTFDADAYYAAKRAEEAERVARNDRREAIAAEEYAKIKASGRVVARRADKHADKMTVAEAKSLAASIAIMRVYSDEAV